MCAGLLEEVLHKARTNLARLQARAEEAAAAPAAAAAAALLAVRARAPGDRVTAEYTGLFLDLPELPTRVELFTAPLGLNPHLRSRPYPSLDLYVETTYRLLREDMFGPMREAILERQVRGHTQPCRNDRPAAAARARVHRPPGCCFMWEALCSTGQSTVTAVREPDPPPSRPPAHSTTFLRLTQCGCVSVKGVMAPAGSGWQG
jgi:hypothetical protein